MLKIKNTHRLQQLMDKDTGRDFTLTNIVEGEKLYHFRFANSNGLTIHIVSLSRILRPSSIGPAYHFTYSGNGVTADWFSDVENARLAILRELKYKMIC